jgi:hypothetical protein
MKFDFIISHPKEIKKYALLTTEDGTPLIEGNKNIEVVSETGEHRKIYPTNEPDIFSYEIHVGDYIRLYGKSDVDYASYKIEVYKVTDITASEVIAKSC